MELSRRTMLGGLGGLIAGGALAGLVGNAAQAAEPAIKKPSPKDVKRFGQQGGEFGWKPHKLNADECAPIAYDGYWYKGYACGYGTFYGIVGVMGEKYGAPYNQFPFSMLEANKAGVSGWGTVCGALYGAAAAFALFWGRRERDVMVNELFRWYETTQLPIYNPGDTAQGVKGDIPSNASGSVLCHVSVSKWCYTHKKEESSKERSERCGRITADVTRKAIEILNAKIDAGKGYKGVLGKQDSVTYCGECHSKGQASDIQKGKMDCTPCHSGNPHLGDKFKNHPA